MIRTVFHRRSSLSVTIPSKPLTSATTSFFLSLSSRFSGSPILERKHPSPNNDEFNEELGRPPRLFVVQPRIRPETHLRWKLEEALNLANSLEEQRDGFYETEFLDKETPPHLVVQNPMARSPRADTYFGPGTVGNIMCHLNDLESKDGVDAVFVNAILSGVQQRNLERTWGKPVLDRIALIIEIFNAHAQTKEAKLQSDLAALMYKRSRLVRVRGPDGRYTFGGVGEAEVVSARGRGSGGRGFISGAGETELQLQHRRISDQRKKLLSEIKEVRKTRAVQRAARQKEEVAPGQGIATVAVVGYTNAGKSTLVSTLSNSYLYCDDRLFATVDPKLRSVILPSGRKVLLSDTVGFISDLPVQLVEAFHATLEEVVEADLLVHVLDSSAPNLDEHRKTVMQVLGQIGVSEEKRRNMIEVWNKVDILEENSDKGRLDDIDRGINLSDEEDADVTADQSTDQPNDEQDIIAELSQDLGDYSDGWLSFDDEPKDWCVDYKAQSIGCDTVNGPQDELTWPADKAPETSCHVRTSAVTGVGLQELLEMIEEKLPPCRVVETCVFDRKWRPPRDEENNRMKVEL